MNEFYITVEAGNYIKVTSFVKLRVLNIRSQPSVSTKRKPKKKLKLLKYFSTLTILFITQYMKMETSHIG